IAIEALQGVVMMSPVDKGTYRASHQVTNDVIVVTFDLAKTDKSGGATIQKGLEVILSIKEAYGVSIVQTSIPYALALENGHSAQAPSGVYRVVFAGLRAKYAN